MGSYRGRLDIIADILSIVKRNGSARKTQIMYGANLSYTVLTRYLTEILNACLLKFDNDKCRYVLTEKGKKFLQHYREYSRRNEHLTRQLQTVNAKRKILEELCSL
ncbi:MAG: winged helix-turn-helix domain-containing protein [Candidatus Bathyarchaeia archaeon]